jgi:hypothetical protein
MKPMMAALAATLFACSARSSSPASDPRVSCPFNASATVSNRRNVDFDIYYQEGTKPAINIGEAPAMTTLTFKLPGEGRGRVYLQGRSGGYVSPRPGNPVSDIDIRTHC